MHLEIEQIALTEHIGLAKGCVLVRRDRIEERSPEHFGVRCGEAKTGFKHPSFVSAARMKQVQVIVAQLGKIDDGPVAVWYLHPAQHIESAHRSGQETRRGRRR